MFPDDDDSRVTIGQLLLDLCRQIPGSLYFDFLPEVGRHSIFVAPWSVETTKLMVGH